MRAIYAFLPLIVALISWPGVAAGQQANFRFRLESNAVGKEAWTWLASEGRMYAVEDVEMALQAELTSLQLRGLDQVEVEVAKLWTDTVGVVEPGIYRDSDGDRTEEKRRRARVDRTTPRARFEIEVVRDVALPFNRPVKIDLEPVEMNRILYRIGESAPYQDQLIGCLLRVKTPDGKVLGTAEVLNKQPKSFTWDQIEASVAANSPWILIWNTPPDPRVASRLLTSDPERVDEVEGDPVFPQRAIQDISLRWEFDDEVQQIAERSWQEVDPDAGQSVTVEEAPAGYRGEVTYLNREPIPGARVEFAMLWLDPIMVYPPGIYRDPTGRQVRLEREEFMVDWARDRVTFHFEAKEPDALRYGVPVTYEPEPIQLQRFAAKGPLSRNPWRDRLVGVLGRVLDGEGRVISEFAHLPDPDFRQASLSWPSIDLALSRGMSWIPRWDGPPPPDFELESRRTPYSAPRDPVRRETPGTPPATTVREWRKFTDEASRTPIEARLLGEGDRPGTVKVEVRGRGVFDIEVSRLTLDDQLYLQEQLGSEATPAVMANVEMQVEVQAEAGRAGAPWLWITSDGRAYEVESTPHAYRVEWLCREAPELSGAKMQVAALWHDVLAVQPPGRYRDALGDESTLARTRHAADFSGDFARFRLSTVPLETLRAGARGRFKTGAAELERILYEGANGRSYADQPLGVLVRVLDARGRSLMEQVMVERPRESFSWEQIDAALDKGLDWIGAWDVPPLPLDDSEDIEEKLAAHPLSLIEARSEPDAVRKTAVALRLPGFFLDTLTQPSDRTKTFEDRARGTHEVETFTGQFKGSVTYTGKTALRGGRLEAVMLWLDLVMDYSPGKYRNALGDSVRVREGTIFADWSRDRAVFDHVEVPVPTAAPGDRIPLSFEPVALQRYRSKLATSRNPNSDRLLGVMFRLKNADGEVIGSGRSFEEDGDDMRSFTWEAIEHARERGLTWVAAWDRPPAPDQPVTEKETPYSRVDD